MLCAIYAKRHLSKVPNMLSVANMSFMLSVILLNVIMLKFIMLGVIMLKFIMLSVIILRYIMMNVLILSVVAPLFSYVCSLT
jgi:hypothetical protein